MKITKAILRGAYEFLCETPPFCKWNMPDHNDVTFKVVKDPKLFAYYHGGPRRAMRPTIAASESAMEHTATLLESIAHEMIHLYIDVHKVEPRNRGEHSAAFKKLAAIVCKHHGFDPKRF